MDRYLSAYADELYRVWETERPFELHLPTAIINGRADVILDSEGGEATALAIVDYKTSVDPDPQADLEYALQLAVYADAGRREGLNVRAAYVHDLKSAARSSVDVTATAITTAEAEVESASGDCGIGSSFRGRGGRAGGATPAACAAGKPKADKPQFLNDSGGSSQHAIRQPTVE